MKKDVFMCKIYHTQISLSNNLINIAPLLSDFWATQIQKWIDIKLTICKNNNQGAQLHHVPLEVE